MIVLAYIPGQLCNLLFLYSKFIAFSLENNTKIKNPSFFQYLHYFKSTAQIGVPMYPIKQPFLNIVLWRKARYKFWYYLTRILHRLKVNNKFITCIYLDWNQSLDMVKNQNLFKSKLVLAQGWQFEAKNLLVKYRNEVVKYFNPQKKHSDNVEAFFKNLSTDSIKIGVHIRHGDYATFEGGKYFYSLDQYVAFLKQVEDLFVEKSILFVICSNCLLKHENFRGINHYFGPNHELEDMLTLAKCDFILGPPSTYSMWASFYGDVPLAKIECSSMKLALNDFKRYHE